MAPVLVNLSGVHFTYFDKPILVGLDWEIQAGQKIGLIGPNGAGKSTLLRLLHGISMADAGSIFRVRDLTTGYLPQDAGELFAADAQDGSATPRTVLDAALSGSPEIARLRRALDAAEARMGDPAVYEQPNRLARVLDEHAHLLHSYEAVGGLTYENRVRSTLRDLGLTDETFEQPLDVLSGGQAKLVGLARLLVWGPGLLLLDEPDNHLDLAGKERLEKLICDYPGTVVIVSHDRYLLDQVVDVIVELDRGQVTSWPGSYTHYAVSKELRLRQEQMYKAQQKRITQIEAAIKRFEEAAAFTQNERHAGARHRRKMLDRMDKVERPGEQARCGWSSAAGGQQQGAGRTGCGEVVCGRRRHQRGAERHRLPGVARRAGGVGGAERRGSPVLFRCISTRDGVRQPAGRCSTGARLR